MTNKKIRQLIKDHEKSLRQESCLKKEKEFDSLCKWFNAKFGPHNIERFTKKDVLLFAEKITWKGEDKEGFWRNLRIPTQWEEIASDENIKKFRGALKFLLYDKCDLELKLNELVQKNSPYNTPILRGKRLVVATAFLAVHKPEEYVSILSLEWKKDILENLSRFPQDLPSDRGKQFVMMNKAFLSFKKEFGIPRWNNYYMFTKFLWNRRSKK